MAAFQPKVLLDRDMTSEVVELIRANLGDSFKDQYLGQCLMAKFAAPDPESKLRREIAAVEKWLATERNNAKTNIRLMFADDEVVGGLRIGDVLAHAARLIRKIIGQKVPMELLRGSFSGGASTSLKRQPGMVPLKFISGHDVTPSAWNLIRPWLENQELTLWTTLRSDPNSHCVETRDLLRPRFVRGNEMFTVPKNDDIDRVACKEPDLNMFLQKAAGDFIRTRLRRVGVNLNDQGPNQVAAKEASVSNANATVDLSSASDSISTQLVCRLLSVDWFVFLEGLRCRVTRLPESVGGGWHENEMIGSMGNGFVFELESLIFYALVKACGELSSRDGRVIVYGDDLIFRSDLVPVVRRVFQFVGFKMNVDKTFADGPFRESCGKHYYAGVDVTPFYLKEPVTTVPDLIRVLNSLRRWAEWYPGHCDPRWYEVWAKLAQYIPYKRLFGGYDLSSKETVASPSGKGCRLMRVFKDAVDEREFKEWRNRKVYSYPRQVLVNLPFIQHGLYLEWQYESETRRALTAERMAVKVATAEWRLKDPRRGFARNFGLSAPAFPQELAQ